MAAQNRCRRHGADISLKAGLYSLRFASVGHDRENFPGFENLTHRHGDRILRHLRNIGEPGLAHLLLSARLIEIYDEIRFFGIKISGRIVEGNMTVLADSKKRDIDRRRSQLASNS